MLIIVDILSYYITGKGDPTSFEDLVPFPLAISAVLLLLLKLKWSVLSFILFVTAAIVAEPSYVSLLICSMLAILMYAPIVLVPRNHRGRGWRD